MQNYWRKTTEATIMKIVPNESKLIYAINILIVASWCLLLSYTLVVIKIQIHIKMSVYSDSNVSVNGNPFILKFTPTFNS